MQVTKINGVIRFSLAEIVYAERFCRKARKVTFGAPDGPFRLATAMLITDGDLAKLARRCSMAVPSARERSAIVDRLWQLGF